jgi:hypothetical protein
MSRQSDHCWRVDCYAPAALYPPERFLLHISFSGWVNARAIVRPEEQVNWKKKIQWHRESNVRPSGCSIVPQPRAPVEVSSLSNSLLYSYSYLTKLTQYTNAGKVKYISHKFPWYAKISPAVQAGPTHDLVRTKAAMMSWSRNLERGVAWGGCLLLPLSHSLSLTPPPP